MLEKEKSEIRYLYRTGHDKKALMELYLLSREELDEIIKGVEVHKYKCTGSDSNARHCRLLLDDHKTLIR